MPFYIPILVFAMLYLSLSWMRRGHGGKLGEHVRRSDWLAWKDAVNEKEAELNALKKMEPRQ